MTAERDRFMIAATLEPVQLGDEFTRFPQHMTVVRPFRFPSVKRGYLDSAMEGMFHDVYQSTVGGELELVKLRYRKNKRAARHMEQVEYGPWFGMRALIKSLGSFRNGDRYVDEFWPHVRDYPERQIKKGERVQFPTVALFGLGEQIGPTHVEAVYRLGAFALEATDD
jgi:hypothetical protein